MTPRFLLSALLAAVVPGLALWFAAPAERASVGLAVAPFGWPSLVVVQVLAALPLAAALASRSRGWFVAPNETIPAWVPAITGSIFAALAYFQMQEIGEALSDWGFSMRAAARTLVCVFLAWPWCLIAAGAAGRVWMLGVAAVAAFALPAIHADALAAKGIREGNDLLLADRLVSARPNWVGVSDLSPKRLAPNFKKETTPPEVVKLIDADVAKLTKQVDAIRPETLSPQVRLQYALALLNLERSAEAEAVLRSLPPETQVLQRLAEARNRQGKFTESDDAVRPLLDSPDASSRSGAYEQLATNASDRHDNAEVERLLLEAIEKVPNSAGRYQFLLGRHYSQVGRPFEALAAFDRAEKLDPKQTPSMEPYRRSIREQTPGCLIGR